jgi:phosphatidylserine/phosphatidylglycerophosphate/cardiolipin synthase-like enzyme
MSRRDLSQPSFVDATVSGYGRVGGSLDWIEQGFDWSAFEALLSPIHGSAMGAPGYRRDEDLERIDVALIGEAAKQIDMTAYLLTDHAVVEALPEATARGVKVRIWRDAGEAVGLGGSVAGS